MATEEPVSEVSWWRRPRKPVPPVLANPLFGLLAAFWLGVVVLVGLGVVLTEEAWWARASGGLVSLLGAATSVLLGAYLLRPVDDSGPDSTAAALDAAIIAWAETLARHGCVEIGLSRTRVARAFAAILFMVLVGVGLLWMGGGAGVASGVVILLMAVFLALMPHLELAAAGRPAVRVDARGIEIARWDPLAIPWSDVVSVHADRGTKTQAHVVVRVTAGFYAGYQATRPLPLRIGDAVAWLFTGPAFTVPSTTEAEPEALAAWLGGEVHRRHAQGPV